MLTSAPTGRPAQGDTYGREHVDLELLTPQSEVDVFFWPVAPG